MHILQTTGYLSFGPMAQRVLHALKGLACFHSMAQCVVHVLKGLACRARATLASRTASSAHRSRRLRSTRAAAPGLLAHAEVTKNTTIFQWVQNVGTRRNHAEG